MRTVSREKLLDPTSLEKGDRHAAIDYFAPSWDGRYVIAGVSLGGSENSTIHVIESDSGRMLPDAIIALHGDTTRSGRLTLRSFYYARLQQLGPLTLRHRRSMRMSGSTCTCWAATWRRTPQSSAPEYRHLSTFLRQAL